MTDSIAPVATPSDTVATDQERRHELRRAATITALAGIIHAVLFLISTALVYSFPGPEASDAEVLEFYASPESRRVLLVGLYLMPFAAIAFLWFIVAVRTWVRASLASKRDELLTEIQLVSGVLYLALFLVSAAALSATAATVEWADSDITAVEARIMPGFGATLLTVLGMRMAAIFVISTTTIARLAPGFPRWMILVGYAVGIFLLLSVSLSPVLLLAFPIWVIVLCLLLLSRARRLPIPIRGV